MTTTSHTPRGVLRKRHKGLMLTALLCILLVLPVAASQPSQVQVARQFLMAILRGDYPKAYALLAPEVVAAVSPAQFRSAALPLHEQGRRYGQPIDLYKLGVRIEDSGNARFFYSFLFKNDTLNSVPKVQLDVTFRDSTATRVLSFGMIPALQTTSK
ncbi:hypothetical protein [Hymenobacter jejuensis]|uniref:DUF3887 domain-containing protein n=1 Tax=Hymenobacter jejuensis TaxID=2502781 RepID=A0A5B8A0I9_9BACT|nr:hypothetical protein [Hymenobacter jejuensis]QDA60758.1 hypothetical protein FHG12_11880 [Hymenobacter jejuensis]